MITKASVLGVNVSRLVHRNTHWTLSGEARREDGKEAAYGQNVNVGEGAAIERLRARNRVGSWTTNRVRELDTAYRNVSWTLDGRPALDY